MFKHDSMKKAYRLKVTFFIMMFCLSAAEGIWAADSKELKIAQPLAKMDSKLAKTAQSNQARLPTNILPNNRVGPGSNIPGGIPGKNSQYFGWQSATQNIKTGNTGSSSGGFAARTQPTGHRLGERNNQTNQAKAGSVADLGREAQLKQLFALPKDIPNLSNGQDLQGGFGHLDAGRGKLPGAGGGLPAATQLDLHQGDGKNHSSLREQQSDVENKIEVVPPEGDRPFEGTAPTHPDKFDGPRYKDPDYKMSGPEMKKEMTERAARNPSTEAPKDNGSLLGKFLGWTSEKLAPWREPDHIVNATTVNNGRGTPNPEGGPSRTGPPNYFQSKPGEFVDPSVPRKRHVELIDENKRQLQPANIQVTKKDILHRLTDNRTTPVDGDGTTREGTSTGFAPGSNPAWRPVNTQPKPGTEPDGGKPA